MKELLIMDQKLLKIHLSHTNIRIISNLKLAVTNVRFSGEN
jgi:hypothetical protein